MRTVEADFVQALDELRLELDGPVNHSQMRGDAHAKCNRIYSAGPLRSPFLYME